MIKKYVALVFVGMLLLIQTGCWDQKIFEKTGFILQLGLEQDKNGQVIYTASIPVISEDIKEKVQIITTNINLMREGRENVRLVSGKRLEGGKTQHISFSKDLAKKGIKDYLEVFIRNTENPMLANLIVVDGSPKEMLELAKEYKDKPRPAFYMNDLLEDARKNARAPETRIYDFITMNYSKTIDPITPIISYDDKEFKIMGSALFDGDKMVGEINTEETVLLNILRGEKRNANYIGRGIAGKSGSESNKSGIAMSVRAAKRKIKVEIVDNKPYIDIELNLAGSLTEYLQDQHLENTDVKKRLEGEIAKNMEAEYISLLKKIQETGADPVGFGEIVRSKHNKYWKSVDWRSAYKDAVFKVEADVNLEFYGAVD